MNGRSTPHELYRAVAGGHHCGCGEWVDVFEDVCPGCRAPICPFCCQALGDTPCRHVAASGPDPRAVVREARAAGLIPPDLDDPRDLQRRGVALRYHRTGQTSRTVLLVRHPVAEA